RSYHPEHEPGALRADTYLALALADSLINHNGDLDAEDLRSRFESLLSSASFNQSGPESACLAALRRVVDGASPANDASAEAINDSSDERVYPVGCLPDRFDVVDLAVKQAKLSQGDSRVWAAAAVLAHSINRFIRGDRLETVDQVRGYVRREFEVAGR